MNQDYYTWTYPHMPPDVRAQLFKKTKSNDEDCLVIVGVIGRSNDIWANKMAAFGMEPNKKHKPADGQIQCYYKPGSSALLLHFETTYDEIILSHQLDLMLQGVNVKTENDDTGVIAFDFDNFYHQVRSRFLCMFLLALHVCHIVVYVETGPIFDITLLNAFRLLKYMRQNHLLGFLPDLLAQSSNGPWQCDTARLCTPRVLFLFENYPKDEDKSRESISAHEFQTEDNIYDLLQHFNIITDSSNTSLLALPKNKQYVFFNAHDELRPDELLKAINLFQETLDMDDTNDDDDTDALIEMAPFPGFVKPHAEKDIPSDEIEERKYREGHTAWRFLQRHVDDVLSNKFDEGSFKQHPTQQKRFQLLSAPVWHDFMAILHKLLVENLHDTSFETSNEEYKFFINNLSDSLNFEKKFWAHLCELGLKQGIAFYKNAAPALYDSTTHNRLLAEARTAFEDEGRGPLAEAAQTKMADICQKHWEDGRQQCEVLSMRGNPCILPKNVTHMKHSSGVTHLSTCNCGRTQGRREDPYTLRQANCEYYEHMANLCNLCVKAKPYSFPIFQPSAHEYRAAAFEVAFPMLTVNSTPQLEHSDSQFNRVYMESMPFSQPMEFGTEETLNNGCSQPSPTFSSGLNMSMLGFNEEDEENAEDDGEDLVTQPDSRITSFSDPLSMETNLENELVLQLNQTSSVKEDANANANVSNDETEKPAVTVVRQASTTEYLPGLVHTLTSEGLLPLFASWSLVCVGPSSVYSHSSGLQEHFQSGFLSGANYLLPWDVFVRLQRAPLPKLTGKRAQRFSKHGDRLMLKIFVGFDYECSRGHRFMMCAPDRVLRGGGDIDRNTSSLVVQNDMPLYYPCPCRGQHSFLAQLMRVHVVTPKAPVNVILDPNIRVAGKYTFTLGCQRAPRLSQSAYWILRLPYVYQGDNVLITPPKELDPENMLAPGYLLAGMFGVAEVEMNEVDESI